MGSLANLFHDLRENAGPYRCVRTGEEFEQKLTAKLSELGFASIPAKEFKDEKCFQPLKDDVSDKDKDHFSSNTSSFDKHFIHQPFGSQQYPDILVLEGDKAIGVEAKFREGGGGKPVWDSDLPRPNGTYIFGSQERGPTFFSGRDVIPSAEDRRALLEFHEGATRRAAKFNEKYMGDQVYGFYVSARKMFDQSKTYNPEAVINLFKNPGRAELEQSVIRMLEEEE